VPFILLHKYMNNNVSKIYPAGNWDISDLLPLGGRQGVSTLRNFRASKMGMYNGPKGALLRNAVQKRKKEIIKQIYTKLKNANEKNIKLPYSSVLASNATNKNFKNLMIWWWQLQKRRKGEYVLPERLQYTEMWNPNWDPKSRSSPLRIKLNINKNLKSAQAYNIWNPNGTPPNAQTMRNIELIWKAEKLISKNKSNNPQVVAEARKILNGVGNKNSYIYKNVNRMVAREENQLLSRANSNIEELQKNMILGINTSNTEKYIKNLTSGLSTGQQVMNRVAKAKRNAVDAIVAKVNFKSSYSVNNAVNKLKKLKNSYANEKAAELPRKAVNALAASASANNEASVGSVIMRLLMLENNYAKKKAVDVIANTVKPNSRSLSRAIYRLKNINSNYARQRGGELVNKLANMNGGPAPRNAAAQARVNNTKRYWKNILNGR
jgi:hypothetical protein